MRAGDRLTAAHAAAVFRTLGGAVQVPLAAGWPSPRPLLGAGAGALSPHPPLHPHPLPPPQLLASGVRAPEWGEELPWQFVWWDQLTAVELPWCDACHGAGGLGEPPGGLGDGDSGSGSFAAPHPCPRMVVVPPWAAQSWEIPQASRRESAVRGRC